MKFEKKTILDVPTLSVTTGDAVFLLDAAIEEGRLTKLGFLNAHMAMLARRDAAYRALLQDFILFNDGIGIDIACLLKYGAAFPDNLNGTDFVPFYLEQTQHPLRLFLFGGTDAVVREVAALFAAQFPRHRIVGSYDGYAPREALPEHIKASRADMILVALGNPLQEKWIDDHLARSGAVVAMGVGGLFDFSAKRVPRAPLFLRTWRCEWIFRFCCEPARLWRRYTVEVIDFLVHALWDALRYRVTGR